MFVFPNMFYYYYFSNYDFGIIHYVKNNLCRKSKIKINK